MDGAARLREPLLERLQSRCPPAHSSTLHPFGLRSEYNVVSMKAAVSIREVQTALANHPEIELAIVFGSVARGEARRDSDVDIAVQMARPLNVDEKMRLIDDIAAATGRPVDLIDLRTVGEPLLGQILKHGQQIRGEAVDLTPLMQRHVYAMEDFMPYVERMLEERRQAWIG